MGCEVGASECDSYRIRSSVITVRKTAGKSSEPITLQEDDFLAVKVALNQLWNFDFINIIARWFVRQVLKSSAFLFYTK